MFIRDIAQILTVVLTFWFWFTPIFYSQDHPKFAKYSYLISWNPLAQIVSGYRHCLLDGRAPDWGSIATTALVSLGVFIAGGMFFRHLKREFVDVL